MSSPEMRGRAPPAFDRNQIRQNHIVNITPNPKSEPIPDCTTIYIAPRHQLPLSIATLFAPLAQLVGALP